MYPIAFEIFGRQIHYYGVMIALGFLAATAILQWKRRRAGFSREQIFDLAMLALFTGIVGARIFYVVLYGSEQHHENIWWVFRIDQGGLVFYGGFICAITAVCIYAGKKKVPIPAMLDIAAPAIAAGHAFGRIGCFLQGCCFGKISDSTDGLLTAVRYPLNIDPGRFPLKLHAVDGFTLPLYPTQIWESIANVLLCALLLGLFPTFRKPGQIAGAYILMYAVIRFMLEFYRADNPIRGFNLTESQIIALFIMLPLGIGLTYYSRKQPDLEHYNG